MEQSTKAATETKRTDTISTAPVAALEVAGETARQLAEASLSANTRRAYLGALEDGSRGRGLGPLPRSSNGRAGEGLPRRRRHRRRTVVSAARQGRPSAAD